MREFTFTTDQLRDLFRAGYDAGMSSAHFQSYDDLATAIMDVINDAKAWDAPDRVTKAQVDDMLKE